MGFNFCLVLLFSFSCKCVLFLLDLRDCMCLVQCHYMESLCFPVSKCFTCLSNLLETHIAVCVHFQKSLVCLGVSLGNWAVHWAPSALKEGNGGAGLQAWRDCLVSISTSCAEQRIHLLTQW